MREALVDDFNKSLGAGCLVINPTVGGTGLNITGANSLIHFTPEWNPAQTEQASSVFTE